MARGGKQPPHEPTAELRRVVWIMSATGQRYADIAMCLGVTLPTLRKHYRDELKRGKLQANANVAGRLYSEAMRGHVRAMMFWLRCQAGWAERHELSGPDGGDIGFSEVRRRVIDPKHHGIEDDGGERSE